MKAYDLAMFLLIFNLVLSFVAGLGVFVTHEDISVDTGNLTELRTGGIFSLLATLGISGLIAGGVYIATRDAYPTKVAAFATLYWGLYANNVSIFYHFIPTSLMTVLTIPYAGVFVAAVLQLDGGGWTTHV